jgi:hypothetical protein
MNLRSPRVPAFALGAAGTLFALYPALRPYSDETTLAGAEAMSSPAWIVAHSCGMVAFVALTAALWCLPRVPGLQRGDRAAPAARVLGWLGASLVLTYYGAETYAVGAIAERAHTDGDASLLEVVDAFRYGPVAMTVFGVGLVLLAAAGVALARSLRHAGARARSAGLVVAAMLVLYLPQFFLPAGGRIAHGLLLGAACLVLAVDVWRRPGLSAAAGAPARAASRRAPGPGSPGRVPPGRRRAGAA